MTSDQTEPYYYARDHVRGPGSWCVRGPGGFQVEVGDKMAALILGKLLSGKTDEAARVAVDYINLNRADVCPKCEGTGKVSVGDGAHPRTIECMKCGGDGKMPTEAR